MPAYLLNQVSKTLLLGAIALFVAVEHDEAAAEPRIEPDRFDVSINLGQALRPTFSFSSSEGFTFSNDPRSSESGFGSQTLTLPDSLHFSGLAGTLNLVIDKSTGRPVVDGIELAPRETLRFVADDSGSIRGLHGRISIRLDF